MFQASYSATAILLHSPNYSQYTSVVGKWVPASAGKAKAGVWFIPLADIRGVWEHTPYLSALDVWSQKGAIQIHVYLTLATTKTIHVKNKTVTHGGGGAQGIMAN